MAGHSSKRFHLLARASGGRSGARRIRSESVESRRVALNGAQKNFKSYPAGPNGAGAKRWSLESHRIALKKAEAACRRLESLSRAALRERPGAFGSATERLFDVVAESDLLGHLAPGGRVPDNFAARCLAISKRRKAALRIERKALAVGVRISTLARLAAGYEGEPEEGVGPGEIAIPGTALIVDRTGRISLRETIPGTSIVLGGDGSKRTARGRAAPRRLQRALAIVDAAWPEAGLEIRRRTRLIIARDEPALVSYSLPSRPGVSFINLKGKRLIDLADDLLHETAHHRLHAVEDAHALIPARVRPAASADLRYWSPWRRAQRPVRGILHAWYTFAFRAELFRRIVRSARTGASMLGPLRLHGALVRELAGEARKENRWIATSLRNLEEAAERGCLTAAGRRLIGLR